MKRIMILMIILLVSVQLTACGRTCKADGCDEKEIYEDGYCRLHYYENVGNHILDDLFN